MKINGIDNPLNKDKIAVVVIGYNRLQSIKRLLSSLMQADYQGREVPLVISIDCSGNEQLYDFVRNFKWHYGEKYLNIQNFRLGLQKHIFQCADLTEYFKAVILLEDDLFLSPVFYNFAEKAVEKYGNDDSIAEIALYRNNDNGYAGFPFEPMQNGADVFLWQDVCTSGEILTKSMWKKFCQWRDSICNNNLIQNADMPRQIKGWARAWSKPYNAFVVSTGRHIVFPYVALSTNFGDSGEHSDTSTIITQVALMYGNKEYCMPENSNLIAYDLYTNNECLYEWLGLSREELCLDIYGQGRDLMNRRYLLTPKILPYKIIKSFGLSMRPIEVNVKYEVDGNGLFLYDTFNASDRRTRNVYSFLFLRFFNNSIGIHHVWRYALQTLLKALKQKLSK